ncbi:hypothetical protein J7L67_06235, partial [bacterium]|nr:hypothetical protein [bacterium]
LSKTTTIYTLFMTHLNLKILSNIVDKKITYPAYLCRFYIQSNKLFSQPYKRNQLIPFKPDHLFSTFASCTSLNAIANVAVLEPHPLVLFVSNRTVASFQI